MGAGTLYVCVPSPRSPKAAEHSASESGAETMPLRLIAARGGVGIELYEPWSTGPLVLSELEWTLPGLSFPMDLSGGVREFRHHRGQLQHARIEVDLDKLAQWLSRRWRSSLGGLLQKVSVWPIHGGIGVGVQGETATVAFDCLWAPNGDTARWVVAQVRGVVERHAAPLAVVLTLLDTALEKRATRQGRILSADAIMRELLGQLLPPLGARIPASAGLWFSELMVQDERAWLNLDATPRPGALPPVTVKALELAELVASADDELVRGHFDEARERYMDALERAPRHPELCQAVAAIDKDFAERAEAALGLLVEALPATAYGLVGAELLAEVGDEAGAELSIQQQVVHERFAPLAAALWLRLSEQCKEPSRRLAALDRALAASPAHAQARWARFSLRQHQGDVNGALADAEHLEAAARGSGNKHRVLLEAARALEANGYVGPARRLYERALRYLPTDAQATLGLARAFARDGHGARALVLLQRAAEQSAEVEPLYSEIQLELGRLLADSGSELALAVARVRRVNGPARLVVPARALEARWRSQLGDQPGASLAFGRMRDAIELAQGPEPGWVDWLLEAGHWARQQGDLLGAERYLVAAEKVRPNLREVRQARALLASELVGAQRARVEPQATPEFVPSAEASAPQVGHEALAAADTAYEPAPDSEDLELRAERLKQELIVTGRLPDAQFKTLVQDLLSLARGPELHALLMGRYEDAVGDERQVLREMLTWALSRLADEAERVGAFDDAGLYRDQLAVL